MKKLICSLVYMYALFICRIIVSTSNYSTLIENKNLENAKGDISVLIFLEDDINSQNIEFTNDLQQNQEIIMNIRNKNKDYYAENNRNFISKNIFTNGSVSASDYSPVIFIKFDDYAGYLTEKRAFQKLSKLDIVKKIHVEETPKFEIASLNNEVGVNTSSSLKLVDIEEAKKMINLNNNLEYNGDKINVGIIDEGFPNNTLNFENNEIVDSNTLLSSTHTNKVASIIGGKYGIASKANLFIHTYHPSNSDYNFDNAIGWLLEKGVNVINISMSSDGITGNLGEYDGYSAYMDYIVWKNYLTIVTSAGNEGEKNGFISNPGIGMNTISVGSIDGDKNISNYSSWKVNPKIDGILINPTLVAPGENIIIPNTSNSMLDVNGNTLYYNVSGTSFAAPMVTGVIALLMEEFPRLMKYPETYISALISSASKLPSQTSLWSTYAGAGLVDYEKARDILNALNYINFTVENSSTVSTELACKELTIDANTKVNYCLFSTQNSNVTIPSSNIYFPNVSKYQVVVYDEMGKTVKTTEYGKNSNINCGTIINSSNMAKKYTIKVYLVKKENLYNEYLSLSISMPLHQHSYDSTYIWKNYTQHLSYCSCKAFQIQGHIITSDAFSSSKKYATCLLCGGNAEKGFIQIDSISNKIQYVTENGSFILPNGVIVLADEDIELYLNGSLEFHIKSSEFME